MRARDRKFAICVENRGADDLEIRKLYRVLGDKHAAATGHLRVVDDSGEDYLYPERYFVLIELPSEVQRVFGRNRAPSKPRATTLRARRSPINSRSR